MNQVGESASSMMTHQPHLLDFSSPPNPAMAFDHNGLLALHDTGTDIPAHRVLIDTTPWPQQVSLSLYNTAAGGSSLVCQQQPFTAAPAPSMPMQPFQLRSSRILGPAKELLSEFCSLEGDLRAAAMNGGAKMGAPKAGKWDDVEVSSSSSPWGNPSLSSMDLLELERRKIRLLSMVEEVDRRYRRYREQIRAVELSFEAVAGAGAAQVYTKLALPAMSRHFRCLRDALVGQIRALRKAMGERDGGGGGGVLAAAGASKGDTPSLRMLDQCLRQQRAFQQSVESYPWRPQRGLPERAVAILRSWLFEHFLHPYPNDVDKHILARQTGLSRSQVSNWFINARVRIWKPMIEDMYLEETKQSDGNYQNPNGGGGGGGGKPVDHNSTTASSTVTVGESSHLHGRNPSSYIPSIVADGSNRGQLHSYPSLHGGGGAVSLTLGLQQQTFGSSMQQQQQQQSLMLGSAGEEEEDVVLPYKNLMGSQLLHNLAGYETDVRRVYN